MSVQEMAAQTAAEIRRRGWHQGSLGSDDYDPQNCRVCILGGINAALHGVPSPDDIDPDNDIPYKDLVAEINTQLGKFAYPSDDFAVAMWNDHADRTSADVLALLDQIAAS